jgi:hypothetical protein
MVGQLWFSQQHPLKHRRAIAASACGIRSASMFSVRAMIKSPIR